MYANLDDKFSWRILCAFLLIVAANAIAGYKQQKWALLSETTQKRIYPEIKLKGKWFAECHKIGDGTYVEDTLLFSRNNAWTRDQHIFSDRDCLMDGLEEIRSFSGNYEITGLERVANHDLYKIDFIINRFFETPVAQATALKFNETHYCNRDDWQIGEKKEVTGHPCRGQSISRGQRTYDVMVKDNKKIYFGNPEFSNLMADKNQRPKAIDKSVEFLYQF